MLAFILRRLLLTLPVIWIVITLVMVVTIIAPAILSESQIAGITPQCERKAQTGQPCFFCGMTTAFIDIAHGRLRDAERANRGSVALYAGFVSNALYLSIFLLSKRD